MDNEGDLRNFQTRVKKHLEEYRRDRLNISGNGIYYYRGKEHSCEHILPKEIEEVNILEKYRVDFFTSEYRQGMKLHKYFHHLNSSQAMCINFFYPLIKDKMLDALLNLLGINGEIDYNPGCVCFEKESDIENTGRRTNFDFYMQLDTGTKIYFEINYTENEFGRAEDIRNLVHSDDSSYVVFVYPTDNKGIREGALAVKNKIIENGWEDHLVLLTWEDLIEQLKRRLGSLELLDYYEKDFSHKYLCT
ncbi:MAG: hypothetical protein Q8912_10120 [Bacillota bacterium]|nr:hypothetical protein [Bacillota bacterium]